MSESIDGVRLFDGERLHDEPCTVTVADGVVTSIERSPAVSAPTTTLLPGLIDAHVHLRRRSELGELTRHGVTTALDMGCWPPDLVDDLRATPDVCDVRSAGTPAIGAGGRHTQIPGMPADAVVHDPDEARALVAARVGEGRDYVKVVLESPGEGGPDQASVDALVEATHRAGLLVVAHASARGAVAMAQHAGVDVLTHAPLDEALDDAEVASVRRAGRVVVPTLAQMRTQAVNVVRPGLSYAAARDTVTALHAAAVPVLAGTDANDLPVLGLAHGASLHDELALLVEAGLTPLEALSGATARTAAVFGLADRGVVEVGRRADLLLVEGDPTTAVSATRGIRGVWIAGRRVV